MKDILDIIKDFVVGMVWYFVFVFANIAVVESTSGTGLLSTLAGVFAVSYGLFMVLVKVIVKGDLT